MAVTQSDKKKIGIRIDGIYYRSINPPLLTDNEVEPIYGRPVFPDFTACGTPKA